MTPGPTIMRVCSSCGKYIAEHTIGSGNTFGARCWTDGKMDAPMLPDQPWLVRCSHCTALVWMDEQEEVGEIEMWEPVTNSEFKDAREADTPAFDDYIGFLQAGVTDKRKERYVRLRTWWAGNDARRECSDTSPLTETETTNLRAFTSLLDPNNDDDRLMKAEALRELGEFEEAKALLEEPFGEDFVQAAEIIRDLNDKHSTAVAEMNLE